MQALRQLGARSELSTLTVGVGLTGLATLVVMRYGASVGLGLVIALAFFSGAVALFLLAPHVAVAATIPLFALLPAAKVLVSLKLGGLKDVVVLAAGVAVALRLLERDGRQTAARTEKSIPVAAALFLLLYVLDLGGATSHSGYGIAWVHGIRLVAEPLILLAAGLLLVEPRKMMDWAARSMIATGCFVASYGLLQQALGGARLVHLGYSYDLQVRAIGSHLRSFGTLDDSFAYAAFLLLALATVVFWMRKGLGAVACALLIGAGIAASLVQTAAVIAGALLALWLARSGRPAAGLVLFAALVATGVALALAAGTATQTRTVRAGPGTYLTLNGRVSVWSALFSDHKRIPLGLGVGKVGRASLRAKIGVTNVSGSASQTKAGEVAVDSGYFTAIADIGVVGLLVLLFLLARMLATLWRATSLRDNVPGWLGVGYLTVLLLDATTRDTFTGFPTAFLGFLLLGICLGSVRDVARAERRAAHT